MERDSNRYHRHHTYTYQDAETFTSDTYTYER